MPYNILTCGGWDVTGFLTFGSCMQSRIGLVVLFFLVAVIRKWGGEEMGISFNFLFSLIFSIIPYLIITTIFGNMKFALVIGIVGALLGGYGAGFFVGGDE